MAHIEYNTILDVSLPLKAGMITYPGNPDFAVEAMPSASGTSMLTKMTFGTHTGTHIDAPKHVDAEAVGLEAFNLDAFVGPCRVLDCTVAKGAVTVDILEQKNIQAGERLLLLTTNSSRGFEEFYEDFVYLDGEAAAWLAERGVALVGIDSLSIKQRGSKDNTSHTALLEKNIPIIEGLNLNKAREGEYVLVASPLRVADSDGAPARVLLLS